MARIYTNNIPALNLILELFCKKLRIQKEWAVIRGAPWSLATISLIILGVVWFFVAQINSATISGKDATIETQKAQIDSYKEKLNGASPDEAKARIDGLEARLARIEPRQLSDVQLARMSEVIKTAFGHYDIFIDKDMVCADCGEYASQIANLLPRDQWSIRMRMVGGPSQASPKGLAVVTPDPLHPSAEAAVLIRALTAAGIPFDVNAGGFARLEDLGKPNQSLLSEILITPRVSAPMPQAR
jgi:hypothetical protein